MRVSPGSNPTFYVAFTDEQLQPKDPDTIYVDVFNALGVKVIDNGTPVKDATGNFHFVVPIPVDGVQGLWKIEWQAVLDGRNAFGSEDFEVALAGILVNPGDMALHAPLRSRVGEVSRLPADQNASDTIFSPAEIAEILTLRNHNLDLATLEGWERKAAHLSRLIDVAESGTQRTLSQKFSQAKVMVDQWQKTIEIFRANRQAALAGRVPGQVINMREEDQFAFVVGFQPNEYSMGPLAAYTRFFPTHRLLVPYLWN